MKGQTRGILIGIFFALLFVYAGAGAYRLLDGPESVPGWRLNPVGGRFVVQSVDAGGPGAALRPGDVALAINSRPLLNPLQARELIDELTRQEPGTPYAMTVQRDGQVVELSLRTGESPAGVWILLSLVIILIPAIFLVTGLAVFLLKPFDKQAVLLALMFGMVIGAVVATNRWIEMLGGARVSESVTWFTFVAVAVQVASLFWWPVFFHFFLIFPEPSPLLRRFPRLEKYLYAPHLIAVFPYLAIVNALSFFAPEQGVKFARDFSALGMVALIPCALYIGGGLLLLMSNYRQAGRSARRKMRVVVAGSIAGFLPVTLLVGLVFLFGLRGEIARWLGYLAVFSFPMFPLSFAYAIVRHRVIPVRLILRRGVRYLLISRGFIIVQAVVVFAVLSFLLSGTRLAAIDAFGPRADIVVTVMATAIAIGVLTFVNQQAMPLIDRRFFRESYDAQQVLAQLGEKIRTVTSARQLLELVAASIQDALHAENVTIFWRDGLTGNYPCALSSHLTEQREVTYETAADLELPGRGAVAERLGRASAPLTVEYRAAKSFLLDSFPTGAGAAQQQERAVLNRVRSALLVPISIKDQLLGVISLAPRLGDLPYSREDRQLLMAIAWQTAFASQNLLLVQQIAEEERLRHELEIATSVQQRLFPQCPPQAERLELWGVCHPARGVGGDYYDFIELGQGLVGIAVADVAGKGISAALLMSTVQASLRSQAPSVNGRLTELVSSMNQLLYSSTDTHSYATFFYAQFDEGTNRLTYVNAGHNPPILVRATSAFTTQASQAVAGIGDARTVVGVAPEESGVMRLTTGGLVIGLFHPCDYEQAAVEMRAGDVLVAYTDGVTEAVNAQGEEFGEKNLHRILAASSHLAARDISDHIVQDVRQWCGDTPQQDDLTLVVMKVR